MARPPLLASRPRMAKLRDPTSHSYPHARREEILHAYQERSSLRGLMRTDCVSLALHRSNTGLTILLK